MNRNELLESKQIPDFSTIPEMLIQKAKHHVRIFC